MTRMLLDDIPVPLLTGHIPPEAQKLAKVMAKMDGHNPDRKMTFYREDPGQEVTRFKFARAHTRYTVPLWKQYIVAAIDSLKEAP